RSWKRPFPTPATSVASVSVSGYQQTQFPYQQPLWTTPAYPDNSSSGHGPLHRINI
ncbi:hypothetical protein A2U01_0103683, partial [Trifolium medium]|nr:hypothetical protein [Trifolium medium]